MTPMTLVPRTGAVFDVVAIFIFAPAMSNDAGLKVDSIFFFRAAIVWPVPSSRRLAISRVIVVADPPPMPMGVPESPATDSRRRGLLRIGRSSVGLGTQ